MLTIKNINTYYGQVHALKNVSLHLQEGEIVTLIGANGAGKTTLLNTISGVTPPKSGEILYAGTPIQRLAPHSIVSLGISQVPEGRQVFKPLSVEDNLELGAYLQMRRRGGAREARKTLETVYNLFPILLERRKQPAGTLSGGEQQMLAIGRALMAKPRIMLLDEPSMGLAPLVVKEIFRVIVSLAMDKGTTILLVEQKRQGGPENRAAGLRTGKGKVILDGDADDLIENTGLQRAYLGRDKKEIWNDRNVWGGRAMKLWDPLLKPCPGKTWHNLQLEKLHWPRSTGL
jgi:branched-chain amino acid transport system ATP-binding protein